jgi:hypothetical protein
MGSTTRATVYFDTALHQALRRKAASTRRSIPELVADAARASLRADREDLVAVAHRAAEPTVTCEAFLKKLKADGRL